MYYNRPLLSFLLSLILLPAIILAQNQNYKIYHLDKNNPDSVAHFNINNISTFIYNNGNADVNISLGIAGFVYPKGSGKTAIYESGLIWGGKIDGKIHVGGSTYISGLRPGRIISRGVASDPTDIKNRVYRVRPDYIYAALTSEINGGEGTANEIRIKYAKDWNEWPASYGAPYEDVDSNGTYNPNIDIPGVHGAAQTLWFVANDLDSTVTRGLYGSLPMGIEVQVTVWGYNLPVSDHALLKKYKLINKGGKKINDMYITMWTDPDLGSSNDDFVGCDTLLNLGFVYNAHSVDNTYAPLSPPAGGFTLLQGPVVDGAPNDTAQIEERKIPGKKNIGMTSFFYIVGADPVLSLPPFRYYGSTLEIYNFMQSKIGVTGEHFKYPDQFGGGLTNYMLPGDPVSNTGWVDGISLPRGDRNFGLTSGPFTMAVSDTQEVVYAEVIAGADSGHTNISAISLLKKYCEEIQKAYFSSDYGEIFFPNNFKLLQNYPNPFNSSTIISYLLPEKEFITLKVYDILGREIKTLVNETVNAGYHKVVLDASSLASGVYFYRITDGMFSTVKKMILLR